MCDRLCSSCRLRPELPSVETDVWFLVTVPPNSRSRGVAVNRMVTMSGRNQPSLSGFWGLKLLRSGLILAVSMRWTSMPLSASRDRFSSEIAFSSLSVLYTAMGWLRRKWFSREKNASSCSPSGRCANSLLARPRSGITRPGYLRAMLSSTCWA
ncbi:hypothetical protein DEF24_25890 [Marinitenerispora sediminis]|uniref:Uncharacterized protein n=1 Tax=Marinitenerispora sediminis TaxID=1931232 RepID=A0A368SY57_9ACTN|nr:hypothetical protein DEF24_25890 [Marinitenerispora sediminis]